MSSKSAESPMLKLTTTVDWKPNDCAGQPVPDGYLARCVCADGTELQSVIAGGAARFTSIPLGTTRFEVVERRIYDLAFSKDRVPADQEVHLLFRAKGFLGGEELKVAIFECDQDGGRERVELIETELPKGEGDFVLTWKRGEEAALKDLLKDLDAGDSLVEYRFKVTIGGTEAPTESTPLHLTYGAKIKIRDDKGKLLPDGAHVMCVEADGRTTSAEVKGGIAIFGDLLMGRTSFYPVKVAREVWLLLRGDQSHIQADIVPAEEKVKREAQVRGAVLLEGELTTAAELTKMLRTKNLAQVFHSGHGAGGGLTAIDGKPIYVTDVPDDPAFRKITFRSIACELGTAAKDWDLTFGDVYGGSHLSNLAKGIDFFTLQQVHADQDQYRDLNERSGVVVTQAYGLKMRAATQPKIVVQANAASLRQQIAALRTEIAARAAEGGGDNDAGGGYSGGTDKQLQERLDRAAGWLDEAYATAR